MAMTSPQDVRVLRVACSRLAATPLEQLPIVVPKVASSILGCRALLSNPSMAKNTEESAGLVQKFRTQITTFLNAKTTIGRWTGIILVKAVIEVGGTETLSKSAPWVRSMLSNLNKADPLLNERLAIITLTRIFDLTHGHPSIVREMTTPSLPTFITACLNRVDSKSGSRHTPQQGQARYRLLPSILASFAHLLPSHPTIFRSYMSQLQHLLLPLIAVDASAASVSEETQDLARHLFVLLPFSAMKTNKTSPAENYSSTFDTIISTTHNTLSLIFRSVLEDWAPMSDSVDGQRTQNIDLDLVSGDVDQLGLAPWAGIHNGCDRLRSLLSIIRAMTLTRTSGSIFFPISRITDLIVRICGVLVPLPAKPTKGFQESASIRNNEQISQTERDALFTELPIIHASALQLVHSLCHRLGSASRSLHDAYLEQIIWVFEREKFHAPLRSSSYEAASAIFEDSAAGFRKDTVRRCTSLLETCCDDVLASISQSEQAEEDKKVLSADTLSLAPKNGNEAVNTNPFRALESVAPLSRAASNLLSTALARLPAHYITDSLRARMDRTAILVQDVRMLLSSALNQNPAVSSSKTRHSVLPFLARIAPSSIEVEGLLRPRMPVFTGVKISTDRVEDEIQDEVMNEDNQDLTALDDDSPDQDIVLEEHIWHKSPESLLEKPTEADALDREHRGISKEIPQKRSAPLSFLNVNGHNVSIGTSTTETSISKRVRLDNHSVDEKMSESTRAMRTRPSETASTNETSSHNRSNTALSQSSVADPDAGNLSAPVTGEQVDENDASDIPDLILETDSDEEDGEQGGDDY